MNKKLSLAADSDNFVKISTYGQHYSYKNDNKLSSYNNNKNSGLYWFTLYMYFHVRFDMEIKRIPEGLVFISKIHDAPKDESNKISQKINNINKFSIKACGNINEEDYYED